MGKASRTRKSSFKVGMVLGVTAYAKISAVEGLEVDDDLKRDLARLEAEKMSDKKRSRFIARKYGVPAS